MNMNELPSPDFGPQTSVFHLLSPVFGLPSSDFRLPSPNFRLQTNKV